MTYALNSDEIVDPLAANKCESIGRTFPAMGVALIVAVDAAAVWLLRLVF